MNEGLIDVIMRCITSTTLNVLWNSNKTSEFKPSIGLHQGDPLSPYLFVLCMDKFSHIICDVVAKKRWNPI